MSEPRRRSEVTFTSDGERIAAYLYRPDGDAPGPRPCVVMAHGFSGTRDDALPPFAERFAAAGLVVLLFDYRHFGASGGRPRQLIEVGRQQADYRAAIAYARGLEGVDPERIALWGTSFSGGHVMAVAAKDPRIAAVVSQVPFVDGLAAARAVPIGNVVKLGLAGARDQVGALFGRKPHSVAVVGQPGQVAAMTAREAVPGMVKMVTPSTRWRNDLPARLMLTLPLYRPVRLARKLRMPWLVIVADHDQTTPPGPAVRAAQRAPRGELIRLPIGHFEAYVGEDFERVVTAETEFYTRTLG
ncbi:alpha/beta hydrolase [Spongisporangium articulatum]|uniref:Alpha/beta hydrolase n=1 Tax=Spongisporangium articulatum TaxID=3362603 RepID=A0ABW8ATC9_9ACTN